MIRPSLTASLAFAVLLFASKAAPAQAPAVSLPPPMIVPPSGVTYYSGPGVVYFATPTQAFFASAPLPPTVYPPVLTHTVGPVTTYVGFGIFRPRGVYTSYQPGYLSAGTPPLSGQ